MAKPRWPRYELAVCSRRGPVGTFAAGFSAAISLWIAALVAVLSDPSDHRRGVLGVGCYRSGVGARA